VPTADLEEKCTTNVWCIPSKKAVLVCMTICMYCLKMVSHVCCWVSAGFLNLGYWGRSHLSLLCFYSNQVIANGRGYWTAQWAKGVCYGRSITQNTALKMLISAFPGMPGAEHRRPVRLLATPCSVLCSPC